MVGLTEHIVSVCPGLLIAPAGVILGIISVNERYCGIIHMGACLPGPSEDCIGYQAADWCPIIPPHPPPGCHPVMK